MALENVAYNIYVAIIQAFSKISHDVFVESIKNYGLTHTIMPISSLLK